jgi:hypothetical protein
MKQEMSRRAFVSGAAVAAGAAGIGVLQAGEAPPRDDRIMAANRAVITDFGAKGDGRVLNTQAIQAAVDACAARGGGTVVVPPGEFVSGTIVLKSRTTLYSAPGAVLRGSGNLADYPPAPFRHNELGETRSLPYAIGQSDNCWIEPRSVDCCGCFWPSGGPEGYGPSRDSGCGPLRLPLLPDGDSLRARPRDTFSRLRGLFQGLLGRLRRLEVAGAVAHGSRRLCIARRAMRYRRPGAARRPA